MKKKNLLLGILALALILAFAFAGCEIIDQNEDPEGPTREKETVPNATITLDSNTVYQYVRGFGGMDITWDNYSAISLAEYDKMYDPNQLGFNILRIMFNPINGRGPNITPDGPTDEDKKFAHTTDPLEFLEFITSAEGGRPNYYNAVKKINGYGGYVLASPWSPPRAWKTRNSVIGSQNDKLKLEHYQDYADYLRTFAQKMAQEGAPIYAISIQNEPNYSTSVENYEGCGWGNEEMRDFFQQVGNFTQAGTYGTVTYNTSIPGYGGGKATARVLIMNGESANTPAIHAPAMQDPTSRGIIDLLARHNYGELNARPFNPGADYGKEMWMTEINRNSGSAATYPNDSTWNYVWIFLNDVDMTIRQRGDNAYIWWALKRFYSMIGNGTYGTTEGEILPRGYALSHYAKYAKEKYRIDLTVSGELGDGSTIVFNNSNISTVNVNYYTPTGTPNGDHISAKVTAFMSASGNEISVVMYVPTDTTGTSKIGPEGLGTVRIDLPAGFIAGDVTAIRSSATVKAKPELPFFGRDGNGSYAIVTLPRSEILSVRFIKQQQ